MVRRWPVNPLRDFLRTALRRGRKIDVLSKRDTIYLESITTRVPKSEVCWPRFNRPSVMTDRQLELVHRGSIKTDADAASCVNPLTPNEQRSVVRTSDSEHYLCQFSAEAVRLPVAKIDCRARA